MSDDREHQAFGEAPQPQAHVARGPLRWLGAAAWRLVRPVARPASWRLRAFLVRPVLEEVWAVRAQQDALMEQVRWLTEARTTPPSPLHAPSSGPIDAGLFVALERLLLTLALEDAARPAPGLTDREPAR